jgi:excisionase family DNA binding protein
MNRTPEVLNTKETAAFLGVHVETVRRLARSGALPSFKVGKDWRFRREVLLQWIEEQRLNRPGTSPARQS